jgi:hypothetical protein
VPDFQLNRTYSRAEISKKVGGGTQTYLPSVEGRIVAGCFTPDLNPRCPEEVIPGTGPLIVGAARRVAAARATIPVFIKRRSKAYEFIGYYTAVSFDESAEEIDRAAKYSGREDVAGVLRFQKSRDGG